MGTGREAPSPGWEEGFRVSAIRWALDPVSLDRLEDVAWRLTRRCRWEGLEDLAVTPVTRGESLLRGHAVPQRR
jgi:hypothetical protein